MLLMPLVIVLMTLTIILLPSYLKFRDTTYEKASGNGFFETFSSKGNWGEFKIYANLEKLKIKKHLMTNLYIPTEKGHTTEVDMIMINQRGIFVFESKNYSGWIFGAENRKQWMQTFKNGVKNQFFNPIWQNKGHAKALMSVSGLEKEVFYYSYIVFGDDCTLKDITVTSGNVKVCKQNQVMGSLINDFKALPSVLTYQQVDTIYGNLKRYQLADAATKALHIEKLKAIHNK